MVANLFTAITLSPKPQNVLLFRDQTSTLSVFQRLRSEWKQTQEVQNCFRRSVLGPS